MTFGAPIITAAKAHTCHVCRGAIAAGKRYERRTGRDGDGLLFSLATCMVCVNSRTPHHIGDDLGHEQQLRREIEIAAKNWEVTL